jgi:hypothetical protein
MGGVIQIYRGEVCIADGDLAVVVGRPLPEGAHLAQLVELARASEAMAVDMGTKSTRVRFSIQRRHDGEALALDHSLRAPQQLGGVADLVIVFDDGIAVHEWTLADAIWTPIRGEETGSAGVGSRMSFDVAGGIFSYDGTIPSDSVDGGGVDPDYILDGGSPGAAPSETYDAGEP